MTQATRTAGAGLPSDVPEWDRKAVAAPFLDMLRAKAEAEALDPQWMDGLISQLVLALRTAYSPEDAERAAAHLEQLVAAWERYAAWRHGPKAHEAPGDALPSDLQETIARTRATAAGLKVVASRAFSATSGFVADMRENRRLAQERIARERQEVALRAQQPREAALMAREGNAPSVTAMAVDGAAMHRSLVPTWLALVILSWVALFWGAILSAPFSGATVFVASITGGFIAVPLWATLFGFAGMSAARDSTLRSMQFKACEESDPLRLKTAEFAALLDLKPPQVGTINMCNAFAMGLDRDNATVAIGRPLMERLSESETEAVLAHELGHVVFGDMKRMMLMRTFQNATVWYMLAQGLKQFARWVICWAAELYILAFSRKREYWADAVGAALTSKEVMIGALVKLQGAPALTGGERTHARFMFRGTLSTHPTFEQRIEALQKETYLRQLPRKREG